MKTLACDIGTSLLNKGVPAFHLVQPPQGRPFSRRISCSGARYISVEIREDILHRLIDQKGLVVENLRGLDQQAQENIRMLLLDSVLAHD